MKIETMFGTYINVYLRVGRYRADHSLYIAAWDHLEGPLVSVTVCLGDFELEYDESYVDVNNFPQVLEFIVDNGLGTPTGKTRQSGYVTYPVVKFNREAVMNHAYLAMRFDWEDKTCI